MSVKESTNGMAKDFTKFMSIENHYREALDHLREIVSG